MIKIIEKLFSDVLQKLTLIPLYIRIILFIYFVLILIAVKFSGTSLKFDLPSVIINSGFIVIVLAILLTIILIATVIIRQKHKRHQIYYFAKLWYDFYDLLSMLINQIGILLIKNNSIFDDDKLINNIKDYHEKSLKIREIIFKIGEKNLIVNPVADWVELSKQSEYIKMKNYISPFSLLSNLDNPIAEWNLHGKDIGGAMYTSIQFMEYLSFRYKKIAKIKKQLKTV